MADIVIRAPQRADIARLVGDMRPLDRQEVEASNGDPYESVRHALQVSPRMRFAVEVDGELAMLMGVADVSLLGGVGSPWMLGTNLLDHIPGALTRIAVRYRDISTGLYPVLINYVDARNVKNIRWLKRLGFTVADEPVPYGPKGLPFYKFELRS